MINIQTRPFLEWKLRRRVAALPNVQILDQTDVLQLLSTADNSRITGVQIRRRAATAGEETLTADLVVDASGRGSRMPRWLEDLGYAPVEETNVEMGVGYATRTYRRNPNSGTDMIYILPKPPGETRMGVVTPIEGDRWMVSLCGWQHDYPPTDDAGFLEYARSLPQPDLYEAIKDLEALTPVVSHKIPSSRWRHYERLTRFPEGLAILGDAVCSFNPIYGQGMTTAALDAEALDATLREQRRKYGPGQIVGLAGVFRKRVAKIIATPWQMATTEDFRWPQTTGPRPAGMQFMHWYSGRLHTLAGSDKEVLVTFLQVMNMLKPPTAMFAPKMIWEVLTMRTPRPATSATRPVPGHAEAEPAM
jgi:2-polyprenyl-6-methoxyphenol hydroxylase-like FAD-dependent oxidoreductase